MNPVEAIKSCFQKYGSIKGRASRSEYWWFYLFCMVLIFTFLLIDPSQVLLFLASIVFVIPGLTVTIRRLHDFNLSGWWALVLVLPFIGTLWGIILGIIRGTDGANRFGEPPLSTSDNT